MKKFVLLFFFFYLINIEVYVSTTSTAATETSESTTTTTVETTTELQTKSCKDNSDGMTICSSSCEVTVDGNGVPQSVSGCTCLYNTAYYVITATTGVDSLFDDYIIKCVEGTTTSTTTTTTTVTTTVSGMTAPSGSATTDTPTDDSTDDNEPLVYTGVCNITALEDNKKDMSKIFFYVASIWIILWTLITIITNIVCKESGHHRFIGLFEELAIIVLWVFLGYFVWNPFDDDDVSYILKRAFVFYYISFCP